MINTIINGDCLDVMSNIPDKSIDMILCDLPYGSTQNHWDSIIPLEPLWDQYKRIIKDNGAIVLTAIQPFASQLICSNPKMFKLEIIWVKNKVSGYLNAKKMALKKHENILIFYNKQPTYNPQKTTGHKPVHAFTKTKNGTTYGKTQSGFSGGGSTERYPTSVLEIPVVNNDNPNKIHPSQKPEELFNWLIKTYTNEGDLILDNCVGSGTTCVCAKQLNRNFIGIEANKEFYEASLKRINNIM